MFRYPPKWKKVLNAQLLNKVLTHPKISDLETILSKAYEDYIYWDTFKHQAFPKNITAEEAWAYFKFKYRMNGENTPIMAKDGSFFSYNITKTLYRELSFIDTHSAGFIRSLGEKPTNVESDKLIISGLAEEAIASSQIEGANTTRKVAKDMLISGRKARNKDEQMIINTYKVMSHISEWKDLDLSINMLLEIQTIITRDTLSDEDHSGRLRTDSDTIVVQDAITGEIAHTPPKASMLHTQLNKLILFANAKDGDYDFIHPVLKAIVLHFWLAYLHPFPDGNGRTARAIFYWYLRKRNYWLFQYLSVSQVIKETRTKYDKAYLHSEHDDNDLTYFIYYNVKAIHKSIQNLLSYYNKKIAETQKNKSLADKFNDLNERQIALLKYLVSDNGRDTDIQTHKNIHVISYETARQDLIGLVEKGLVTEIKMVNKKIFIPNSRLIKKII